MELLTLEETADFFKIKNKSAQQKRKYIINKLYNKILPREVTTKVGKDVYFIREKLENFLLNQSSNEVQA